MAVHSLHTCVADYAIHPFLHTTFKRMCALHGYGACVAELVRGPESSFHFVMAICNSCLQASTGARTGDGTDHLYAV